VEFPVPTGREVKPTITELGPLDGIPGEDSGNPGGEENPDGPGATQ
jgi:hypothetical protein